MVEAVLIVVAATVAAFVAFHKRPGSPAAPVPPDASDGPAALPPSPIHKLLQISDRLNAIGESSAHPRDVAENELFREAAGILEGMPAKTVADYVGGANWMLSAAACVAASKRADREDLRGPILRAFRHLRPWPMYYSLRYFEVLDVPPTGGALALHAQEWWVDHPLFPSLLGEYFAGRRDTGEVASFGDEISRVPPEQLTQTERLLRIIDDPMARELLDAMSAFRKTHMDRPFLLTFGRFLESDPSRDLLVEPEALLGLLVQAEACFSQRPPRSLLVIGEPRLGKSSFLSLLSVRAERLGWTVFEAGGPQLQAGQTYIGELEERLRRTLAELDVDKKVLWHIPDFLQLVESGTHRGQTASMLDQIMPAVITGRVIIMSEATPAALTRILQHRPQVRTAFEFVRLKALTDAETRDVASTFATRVASVFRVELGPEVLETATYLTRHYLGTSQLPGALLDLIKLAAQRSAVRDHARLTREDVLSGMAQLTGMPKQVLDDRERVDLRALRAFFSSRVIGQDEAVDAVVERIAMLKAGLTDANKPVGVFLFAGPTGTGKTELAKALAEFLFGSADRLIRLDMSEFQSADAIRKIVGDPDRAESARALTDLVHKQPFSVVLLDEFEKAHPNTWDLFLQVFDDGRLTDAKGHTVDFRHCIVILTSNLGSTIRDESGPGFVAQGQALSPSRVRKVIDATFRPEFINRLDRIIVFRSLTRIDMRQIVAKELSRVLERRGLRHREWAVEWEPSALEFLLDKGFSSTMGARPLKRAIDQHLLAPLAATLVEHRAPEGDQFLFVRSDGRALQVEFVDPDAPADGGPSGDVVEPHAVESALAVPRAMLHPQGTPEETAALAAELRTLEEEIAGERWSSTMAALAVRMQDAEFWVQPDRHATLSRFEVMDRVKAAAATAANLAERLQRSVNPSRRYSRDLVTRLASQIFVVRHGIEDALTEAPVEVVLSVEPTLESGGRTIESARWCERLLDMYRNWAIRRGMRLHEVPGASPQVLLVISGLGAWRLLRNEVGLHVLDYERSGDSHRAVARVAVVPTPPNVSAEDAEQFPALFAELKRLSDSPGIVRRYFLDSSPVIRDSRQGWKTGRSELVFAGNFDLFGEIGAVHQSNPE